MGWKSRWTLSTMCAAVVGCGAGDTRLDPGDLELRDLLGVSTDVAIGWDAEQRASARRVLGDGLETSGEAAELTLGEGRSLDDRVMRALAAADAARSASGDDALGLVDIRVLGDRAGARTPASTTAIAALYGTPPAAPAEIWISERWQDDLPGRGLDLLAALAADAGHTSGPVVVSPGPRLPAIAAYVAGHQAPARLIVNPVLLGSLEPLDGVATDSETKPRVEAAPAIAPREPERRPPPSVVGGREPTGSVRSAGNPYSFYGSVAECASAQRFRCDSCLAAGNCEAITGGADGSTECNALAANDGRGYFLICINLAIAISSVEGCTAEAAPGCARDLDAASELTELENNAVFLDDLTCGGALDGCLADIYGAPPDPFPSLDGGVTPPRPPRDVNVSCSESCDSENNNNCDASAGSCGSGPSCGNSLSCDGACSSSNDQSGCGGNCNACSEDDSGSGGSSGCGGEDSGGGGSCGSSDSGGDSCGGGDSGGSCGSDGGGGDSCGGGSSDSGGGCGGSSSDSGGGCGAGSSGGGGCSGGGGGGGGGSSSCNVVRRSTSAGGTLAVSLAWALLPIPVAAMVRRRSRKRDAQAKTGVQR